MSSCFSKGEERVWMSNGSAELHATEWQGALSRSAARATPSGKVLDAFFTRHLESAGLGMCGFDFGRADLEDENVRRLFSRLVEEVAQDVVTAATGSAPRASLEFLAEHEARWRATWVSWERVLVRWVAHDLPDGGTLSIPEPLDTASYAFELSARVRFGFGRRKADNIPTVEEAELRRQVCDLLLKVSDFVGPDLVREELLTLANVEESLGHMSEAARRTRAAADLCSDAEERRLALEIASVRDSQATGPKSEQ